MLDAGPDQCVHSPDMLIKRLLRWVTKLWQWISPRPARRRNIRNKYKVQSAQLAAGYRMSYRNIPFFSFLRTLTLMGRWPPVMPSKPSSTLPDIRVQIRFEFT